EGAYRYFLSKILQDAYERVVAGATVEGPGGPTGPAAEKITRASITVNGQPDPVLFISKYVPTIRALQATYNFFLDGDLSSTPRNVNDDPAERNDLLLDLNGVDPNVLKGLVGKDVVAIVGTDRLTPTTVRLKVGPPGSTWPFESGLRSTSVRD